MLSISSRNAAPSGIRAYLEGERDGAQRGAEDYYTDSGHTRGQWHGSGAEKLGLAGEINAQHFDHLAAGFDPHTNEALVQRAGDQHRPGWDLTFSAPKSVSIAWGIAEPEQRDAIERAHMQAVERTLQLAEQQQLFITRRGKDGIERETVKPIIATYLHGTSREADPQLHTHSFVMNVGVRDDGRYGTLESKPLYEWKMALGAAYRAELAHELREQGYDIAADRTSFRINDMPRDIERHFSKRRAQIESVMAERGTTSAKAAEVAALNTRKAKDNNHTATTLRAQWREQAQQLGLTMNHVSALQHDHVQAAPSPAHEPSREIIERLSREHSTFTRADLLRGAAEQGQVNGGIDAAVQRLERMIKDESIVQLTANRFTTREMLQLEREAIDRAQRLSHERAYPVKTADIEHAAHHRTLSDEQRDALHHLTNPSRLAAMEGLAGTGKSHLLGAAREAWETSGYEVRGAALAGKAAKGLQDGSGIRSQTLHSLLADLSSGRDQLSERTVLVIDEAGMIGSRQMARLLDATDTAHAKVVLVGDANQLQPIDAGQLFERVTHTVGAARLTDIRRQRDVSDRDMVHALARGDTRAALDSLQARGRIHASPDREQAMQQLVQDWHTARDPHQPGEDVMLAATRADTRSLNRLARETLREQGDLGAEHRVEAAHGSMELAVGDRLVMTRNAKVLGLMNGELATVTALHERKGDIEITAQLDEGRTRTWRVSEYPHLEHGYALTAHKAQGVTVDRAYVLVHESMSAKEWSYVAGSRAREAVHLYAEHTTANDLEKIMGRSHKKDTALDYVSTTRAVELER